MPLPPWFLLPTMGTSAPTGGTQAPTQATPSLPTMQEGVQPVPDTRVATALGNAATSVGVAGRGLGLMNSPMAPYLNAASGLLSVPAAFLDPNIGAAGRGFATARGALGTAALVPPLARTTIADVAPSLGGSWLGGQSALGTASAGLGIASGAYGLASGQGDPGMNAAGVIGGGMAMAGVPFAGPMIAAAGLSNALLGPGNQRAREWARISQRTQGARVGLSQVATALNAPDEATLVANLRRPLGIDGGTVGGTIRALLEGNLRGDYLTPEFTWEPRPEYAAVVAYLDRLGIAPSEANLGPHAPNNIRELLAYSGDSGRRIGPPSQAGHVTWDSMLQPVASWVARAHPDMVQAGAPLVMPREQWINMVPERFMAGAAGRASDASGLGYYNELRQLRPGALDQYLRDYSGDVLSEEGGLHPDVRAWITEYARTHNITLSGRRSPPGVSTDLASGGA